MNVHKNAKQTPRALRKWVARFKADGVEGLIDRSSRPHHLRAVTPEPAGAGTGRITRYDTIDNTLTKVRR